jgi:hypothetical protein
MTRRVTRDLVSGPLRCRVSSRARPVTLATTSTIGAACLGMAVLVTARNAHGGASARLVYARAPEASSCPDESALRSAVAARLGYDPFFPWAKQTVVVQVWRENRQFKARLQLVDAAGLAHGTRSLASGQPACAELFDAAALAISIAMDSLPKDEPPPASAKDSANASANPNDSANASTNPNDSANASTNANDSAPTPAPVAAPALEATPSPLPPGPARRVDVGVDVLGAAGVEPGPTVGGAVFAALRTRAVSVSVEGRVDAPASAASASTPGRVSAWSVQAALVPCARYRDASFCAVGVLGRLRAVSTGITDPRPDEGLFVAAGARVGFDWPLSETLSLRTHLDATVDLLRAHMQIGGKPAWTAPPFAGAAAAGLAAHFW